MSLKPNRKTTSIMAIALAIFLTILLALYFTNSPTPTITQSQAAQPMTQILFQPNTLTADLTNSYDIEIFAETNAPTDETIDYINLKLEYDPAYLDVTSVTDGDHPGIYQNTILVNESRKPVGIVSIVWIPLDKVGLKSEVASIAKLAIKPTALVGQGMNISQLTNIDDWLSNVIETDKGTPIPLLSDGLSINGGSTDISRELQVKNSCVNRCSPGELCIGGSCQLIAYSQTSSSTVLGVSTDIDNKYDLNNDNQVNLNDFAILLSDIKMCQRDDKCIVRSDLTGDGKVSQSDHYEFIKYFESEIQ